MPHPHERDSTNNGYTTGTATAMALGAAGVFTAGQVAWGMGKQAFNRPNVSWGGPFENKAGTLYSGRRHRPGGLLRGAVGLAKRHPLAAGAVGLALHEA